MPAKIYELGERKRPKAATFEEVLRLHEIEHYSYTQIGRLFNISKQRVKQLCDKAKERAPQPAYRTLPRVSLRSSEE